MHAHSSLPRPRHRSWLKALSALPLVLALGTPAHAVPLDPNAYDSLGILTGVVGRLTFDTSTLELSGSLIRSVIDPPLQVSLSGEIQSQVGGPEIAVFSFNNIDLGAGVTIDITGSRPAAILSRGDAIFRQNVSARAGGGAGGATPNAGVGPGGGQPGFTGGGGGFGGVGGRGTGLTNPSDDNLLSGAGGAAYGNASGTLQGGSGGGATNGFLRFLEGGDGGGALQIVALGTAQVANVFATGGDATAGGGGSGGMIAVYGGRVRFGAGAVLDASGGNALDKRQGGTGGGGGGGRVLVQSREFAWGEQAPGVDVSGGVAQGSEPRLEGPEAGAPGEFAFRTGTLSVGSGQAFTLTNSPVLLPGTSQTLDFENLRIDTGGLAFATSAFELRGPLQMNGGFVTAPLGLKVGPDASLRGFGTVSGPLTTTAGTFLVAEHGSLSVGDLVSARGVQVEGFVAVDTRSTLLLQSADRITLGQGTRLFSNSRLASINGLEVAEGTSIESFGSATVGGTVHNAGHIEGPTAEDQALVFLDDVAGTGDFTGNVVFRGGFSPGNSPAVVSMENAILDPTAALSIEIGGREPGQFDQLLVSGTAALGGTLHLSFIDGFAAQAGDSFAFIVGGSVLGKFTLVDVTGLDPSLRYAIRYSANGVRFDVQAVPEPQTWALLGLGLAVVGLAGTRRRRAGGSKPSP